MTLLDKANSEGGLSAAEFLAATTQERQDYLTNNQYTGHDTPARVAAMALRNVTQETGGHTPLNDQQIQQALSGLDPALAQGISAEFGGIVKQQEQASDSPDFLMDKGWTIPLAMMGAGAAGLGAGASSAATGAGWSGTAAGAGELAGAAGSEALLGSAGADTLAGGSASAGGTAGGGTLDSMWADAIANNPGLSGSSSIGSSGIGTTVGSSAPGWWQTAKSIPGLSSAKDALGTGALSDLARGIPGLISAYGSSQAADSFGDLSQQYMNFGAPSRGRYEASFQPGFSMGQDPGYADAMNQASKANLHGLSTQGNPAMSPNAQSQNLTDLYQRTAYPALQNYRSMNSAAGGLPSFAPAGVGAAAGQVQQQGATYAGLGNATGSIFNPPTDFERMFRAYGGGK